VLNVDSPESRARDPRRRRRRRLRRRLAVPARAVLVLLLLGAGIWLGGHPDWLPSPVRDTLVSDDDSALYAEAVDVIEQDYYRKVDRKQLVNKALGSAVQSLNDRFSNYFDPKAYRSFNEATQGAFEGVGMNVEKVARGLRVLTVFKGSPAATGGLKHGDEIIAVNGHSLAGSSSEQATTRIKGRAGTPVTLTVVTGKEKPREVMLKRAHVDVPVVESRMTHAGSEKVAYVKLASFTSGAHGEVGKAVRGLVGKGAKAVVLDLRDNGGGLLNEAVLVSSIFIPEGKVVTTRGRSRPERVYEATGGAISTKIPVVVLVNGESASASEIVTGALKDRHRATVVGTRTFGKGVFQEIKQLSNGGALDITVGEYFTPSGKNLGGGGPKKGAGITPDVQAQDNPKTKRDEALAIAVKTVARGHA
jgi:carboxyl-terminal processing protease